MSNPFAGLITADLKQEFIYMIDSLFDGCKLPCEVVLPPTKFQDCECVLDNKGNRGPNPFVGGGQGKHTGTCVKCQGAQKIPVKNSSTVDLIILWDEKKFISLTDAVVSADGAIQTFCHIDKIDLLKNAQYVIFNTNIRALGDYHYVRDGEPSPIGFGKDHYMLVNWKRS